MHMMGLDLEVITLELNKYAVPTHHCRIAFISCVCF